MKLSTKRNFFAAMILSFGVIAAAPVFAGNPHWGDLELERSRAAALRTNCKDAQGRCIESKMMSSNDVYKCQMHKTRATSDTQGATGAWVLQMFCG